MSADDTADQPADESAGGGTPDPALAGAGLSATGKTADQFSPGDDSPGTTYGDSGGTGTADEESTSGDTSADLAQGSGGNAEGGDDT